MPGDQYEPVIGLEIHAELQTNSKMFCGCSASYAASPEPNTLVCPVCTAQPGALPVLNKKAVDQGILVGLALNCEINRRNIFARKNYFYPDLPKGYQISQYDLPLTSNGWLEITRADGETGCVRVRRVHLEEDTAKTYHQGNYALIDYNRAGVPLLEIVSEPDMHTVDEALEYATKIRAILRYLGVNSGDMEKGVLRFEANVSVRPCGSQILGTRTEIKNLNSFRALTHASTYEIERQIAILEAGGKILQETLGWDDTRGVTVSQRSKEHAHDYRYFPEPDLPPLEVNSAWIERIRGRLPELPDAKSKRFVQQYDLSPQDAKLLTSEKALASYFEATVSSSKSPARMVCNWVVGEFLRLVNDRNINLESIPVPPEHLAELVDLTAEKTITLNTAKALLPEMFDSGRNPKTIVEAKGLGKISDEDYLSQIVSQVIVDNPEPVARYLDGKETIFKWLMGQVAQATKGKADPQVVNKLLAQALQKLKANRTP